MSKDPVKPCLNVDILDQAICQAKHFNSPPKKAGDTLKVECSGGHVVDFIAGFDSPGAKGDLQWYLKAPALSALLAALPAHKCSLTIEHNGYKDYYESIKDAVAELEAYFVSKEEAERALDTGEVWTIQWYPHTPVGFYRVAASTLAAAIEGAEARNE